MLLHHTHLDYASPYLSSRLYDVPLHLTHLEYVPLTYPVHPHPHSLTLWCIWLCPTTPHPMIMFLSHLTNPVDYDVPPHLTNSTFSFLHFVVYLAMSPYTSPNDYVPVPPYLSSGLWCPPTPYPSRLCSSPNLSSSPPTPSYPSRLMLPLPIQYISPT